MQIQYINLTPHEVVVKSINKQNIYLPSSMPARVLMEEIRPSRANLSRGEEMERIIGPGSPTGLPLPVPLYFGEGDDDNGNLVETRFIVSAIVAQAAPDRKDLVCPDTDLACRDAKGQIISVPGFVRYAPSRSEEVIRDIMAYKAVDADDEAYHLTAVLKRHGYVDSKERVKKK